MKTKNARRSKNVIDTRNIVRDKKGVPVVGMSKAEERAANVKKVSNEYAKKIKRGDFGN